MEAKKYIVHHEGYWRNEDKDQIPEIGGVFFVHESSYNPKTEILKIEQLLFIGEGSNIKNCIVNHQMATSWKNKLKPNKELTFSIALVKNEDRMRITSAYISFHQPVLNHVSDFSFFQDSTVVISHGNLGLIEQVVDIAKQNSEALQMNFANVG